MTAVATRAGDLAGRVARDADARAQAADVRALRRGDRAEGRARRLDLRPVPAPPRRARGPRASAPAHRALPASDSDLPREKTLATLTRSRLPAKVAKMLPTLCEGGFVERGDNVLAFGLPGRGKTHLVCAIGHELIQRGYRVLFTPTFALVQRLLAAKRDLRLEKELADPRRLRRGRSSTTSATSSRAATRWRSSSPSSPSATSAGA